MGRNNLIQWALVVSIFTMVAASCPPNYSLYNGNCYGSPQNTLLSFEDAESYCVSQGGHLTSVTSQSEFDFIVSLISQYKAREPTFWNDAWIGLSHPNPITYPSDYETRRRGWGWSDGAPYSFQAWGEFQPSVSEKFVRVIKARWVGSLFSGRLTNFICKTAVNQFRVVVPQTHNPLRPVSTPFPQQWPTTLPPMLSWPFTFSTPNYQRFVPSVKPTELDFRPPTFIPLPSTEALTKRTTILNVITPTTSHGTTQYATTETKRVKTEENTVLTKFNNDDQNEIAGNKQQTGVTAEKGFSMKLLPVAATVPAVALVMIIILIGVICGRKRASKSTYQDSESAASSKDLQMSPVSTIKDPTKSQYYNETYRSLSAFVRKNGIAPHNYGSTPPLYGNTSISGTSTVSTVKSCYQNEYMG